MDSSILIDVLREAFVTAGVLLAPAMIVAAVVGAVMSLLQAITQIQDQAISFVPKLVVVGVLLIALMPWMTDYYVEYAREAIIRIPSIVFGG